MSIGTDNRVHRRREILLKDKATLKLSKEFLLKVHYSHFRVANNTEWSGILLFTTAEGNVNDPANWVINVEDLIPMNVGTSGYTEYDFDSADAFAFDAMSEAMLAGKKVGHCHTHHSMGTFFSGTDMSELHDNAPNHNYYLSLIVDYKEPAFWKAKVAICGTIKEQGTRVVSGKINRTRNWFSASGDSTQEEEEEDLTTNEIIDNTVEVLYIIDCEIDYQNDAKAFQGRITELTKPKTYAYPGSTNYEAWDRLAASKTGLGTTMHTVSKEDTATNARVKNEGNTQRTEVSPNRSKVVDKFSEQSCASTDNAFCPGAVKPFLVQLLAQNVEADNELSEVFMKLLKYTDAERAALLDAIEDSFEPLADAFFELRKNTSDKMIQYHAIVTSIEDILHPWRNFSFTMELLAQLDVYYMTDAYVAPEEVYRLTGIMSVI